MRVTAILVILVAGISTAQAQPAVDDDGVVNNASYLSSGLPNGGVAQGSIFAVFGRRMGPATLVTADSFPLPRSLGGTSIKVTVGGTTVDAIILYTVAGQVGAILPSNTPVGDGTLTVTFNGQSSAPARIRVVRSAVGIFTINQAGSGPAVVTDTDFKVNLITDAFAQDKVVIIWATGIGPVTGDEAAGPLPGAAPANVNVEVFIGGQRAEGLARGRSGCCAGLDQIAVRVPRGIEGCYVPVLVRVDGVVSNYGTIAISSRGRTCSDPHGFSPGDLDKIVNGGNLSTGAVLLLRTGIKFSAPAPVGNIDLKTDTGSGSFIRFDFGRLIRSQRAVSGFAPFGACLVSTFRGQASVTDPIQPDPLDAGPVLNLSGPKGAKQLQRQSSGFYTAQLGGGGIPGLPGGQPDYLDPGNYTVDNGSGGADVGGFRAQLTLPQLLTWTNQDSISTVPRNQGLNITWSGGDPNNEFVSIIGYSSRLSPNVGATFICTERASAGRFTVPSEVLSALPASEQQQGVPTGFLSVGSWPLFDKYRFTARGLDSGYFGYSVSSGKNVNFQ